MNTVSLLLCFRGLEGIRPRSSGSLASGRPMSRGSSWGEIPRAMSDVALLVHWPLFLRAYGRFWRWPC